MTQDYSQSQSAIIEAAKSKPLQAYTAEQLLEITRCAQDPIYFCNQHCYIITIDEGLVKKPLFPYQETIVKAAVTNNFTICKLPRQSGKTQCIALLVLWLLLFNDAYNIGIIAQNEKTAVGILKRVKTAYENLPPYLKRGVTGWAQTSISLDNGSSITVSGTSAASARGGSYNFLYLDEFAFVPPHIQEEFYKSTLPTISAGKTGKVLISSTPQGLDLFYKIWHESEIGLNDFRRIAIEWNDVPGRDEAWRIKQIKLMGQDGFDQEYNTEFLGSSHTLISGKKLKTLTFDQPLQKHEGLDIYSLPATNRLYVVSCDVARGVHLDDSAFAVIDVTAWPYRLVAKYKNNKINTIDYAQLIFNVASNYNQAYTLVEINDIGQEIVDILFNDFEYTNLFSHHSKNKQKQVVAALAENSNAQLGIRTTRLVKRLGCNTLKNLIENDKLILNDYDMNKQLSKFCQKGSSYEADDGHDDLVMTLVLFAWLSDTPLFKEMATKNFRKELLAEVITKHEQAMAVFGFHSSGLNTTKMVSVEKNGQVLDQFEMWLRGDEVNDERTVTIDNQFFIGNPHPFR